MRKVSGRLIEPANRKTAEKEKQKTITFYSFKSANPWEHSAVEIDGKYYSAYPKSHFLTEEERKDKDDQRVQRPPGEAEDTIDGFLRMVGPMIGEPLGFEHPDEIKKYPHRKTEVKVTAEQEAKALAIAENIVKLAEEGKIQYSVFSDNGVSCAQVAHEVLEKAIVDPNNPNEVKATKRPIWEQKVAIPQMVYNQAEMVGKMRNGEAIEVPEQKTSPRFFAKKFNESQQYKLEMIRGIRKEPANDREFNPVKKNK